ncbi:hypothetical protein BJ508DRAFT_157814 [Ascobolus immersus RN42]|uniref:Cyanovirin-N domain-containing protein n=1 Tax=Ascobolus immersus RN42 TaxID=1160509 RepID=A0A3N4IIF9_ASCIM|nr:hypothetical protein BJ508DRAFT_157814 [Ascobolus immersus RN42]
MFTILQTLFTTALLLLATTASPTGALQAQPGPKSFLQTCNITSITGAPAIIPEFGVIERSLDDDDDRGPVLNAQCAKADGRTWNTKIALGQCWGNDDGKIVPMKGGSFHASCKDSRLIAVFNVFVSTCRTKGRNGRWVSTHYDLRSDFNIVNIDGVLHCFGEKFPEPVDQNDSVFYPVVGAGSGR